MGRGYKTNSSWYYEYMPDVSIPIHFLFLMAVVVLFLLLTWYVSYEPMFEDIIDNFKLGLMVCPVLLLLFLHWLSSMSADHDYPERAGPLRLVSRLLPEKDSVHRVGGSPVGVAALVVLLMFMTSHHTSFQERWFPLFAKR
ncbi:uncharacterized protein LOC127239279 [Andrographis paniculata]|uniref:uncharacterized protein LOC127239279 n=1 Tax=Andrographis paniculata TaxID=175694 RepID=UPI0021E7F90F|nr:uncharacterized protein LOC127239279 [Andrographis paniculata]